MKRATKIVSLIFNILIIAAVVVGTINVFFPFYSSNNPETIVEAYQAARYPFAWVLCVASLVMVITQIIALAKGKKELPAFPLTLKFVGTVAVWLPLIIDLAYFPILGASVETFVGFITSIDHLIVMIAPAILAFVSFCFLEKARRIRYRFFWVGIIIPLVYGVLVLLLDLFNVVPSGYEFLRVGAYDADHTVANIITMLICLAILLVLGIVFLLIHNAGIKKEEKVVEPAPEAGPKVLRVVKDANGVSRVIHISRSANGRWQVRNGSNIENYDTQAEAIRVANSKAKEIGGSIRIHAQKNQ